MLVLTNLDSINNIPISANISGIRLNNNTVPSTFVQLVKNENKYLGMAKI